MGTDSNGVKRTWLEIVDKSLCVLNCGILYARRIAGTMPCYWMGTSVMLGEDS